MASMACRLTLHNIQNGFKRNDLACRDIYGAILLLVLVVDSDILSPGPNFRLGPRKKDMGTPQLDYFLPGDMLASEHCFLGSRTTRRERERERGGEREREREA